MAGMLPSGVLLQGWLLSPRAEATRQGCTAKNGARRSSSPFPRRCHAAPTPTDVGRLKFTPPFSSSTQRALGHRQPHPDEASRIARTSCILGLGFDALARPTDREGAPPFTLYLLVSSTASVHVYTAFSHSSNPGGSYTPSTRPGWSGTQIPDDHPTTTTGRTVECVLPLRLRSATTSERRRTARARDAVREGHPSSR